MEFRFRIECILTLVHDTLGGIDDAQIAYLIAITLNRMGFCQQPLLTQYLNVSTTNSQLLDYLSGHHRVQSAVFALARLSVAQHPFDAKWEISYSAFGDSLVIREI